MNTLNPTDNPTEPTVIPDPSESSPLKILIVAENASKKMGGEAVKNIYFFKLLRERGIDVYLVCHHRVQAELREIFPDPQDFNRIRFIEDSVWQALLWRSGQVLPYRVKDLIVGQMIHWFTQSQARQVVKTMIQDLGIDLVFEPTPITAKGISFMFDLGVPVVMGPLCGGLDFPPAFQSIDSSLTRFSIQTGRLLAPLMHQLVPGKLQADALIISDDSALQALPQGYQGQIYRLLEPGVDLSGWMGHAVNPPSSDPSGDHSTYPDTSSFGDHATPSDRDPDRPVHFVYLGRFVDWKGVQFLVEAFQYVVAETPAVLDLVGDGELRPELEALVTRLNLHDHVIFHGWQPHDDSIQILKACDVFVMPSLREAGGHAVLEAMALALPVIAANWGGPAATLDPSCAILVDPTSPEAFVQGLATAMVQLARSPDQRRQLGTAGPQRIRDCYLDWEAKVDRLLEIFAEVLKSKPIDPSSRPISSSV